MNNLTDDDEISIRIEKDPLIGQTLAGRYGIVSIIGRGGMGVVYKAKHLAMDRFVAVKTLHIGGDPEALRRFQQEAKAVSQVKHPHTVTLYDFGVSSEGQPFLVMELLNGISLRDALKDGPLSLARANEIFQQVVDALSCAHEAGVVHKDLKPENIMLSQKPGFGPDWVHVLDFGISTMSSSTDRPIGLSRDVGKIVGSPPYMSPEQCSLSAIDNRSDIYSLGICLFECLSGGFPYKARTAIELLECHIAGKPKALREVNVHTSTYESVSQLINKALEKKPDKRHEHIKLFGAELEEAVATDSKRGLALKDRVSMELPRTAEFAQLNKEIIDGLEDEDRHSKAANIVSQLRHMIYGDQEPHKDAKEEEDKVVFFFCPHCKAETQPDLSLCLCCGRSLATKDDFSKLRAARGDFSLPKQKSHQKETPKVSREFSQRTKAAMVKTGRAWTRSLGLLFLSLILILCVFVVSGGYQLVVSSFNSKPPAKQ